MWFSTGFVAIATVIISLENYYIPLASRKVFRLIFYGVNIYFRVRFVFRAVSAKSTVIEESMEVPKINVQFLQEPQNALK